MTRAQYRREKLTLTLRVRRDKLDDRHAEVLSHYVRRQLGRVTDCAVFGEVYVGFGVPGPFIRPGKPVLMVRTMTIEAVCFRDVMPEHANILAHNLNGPVGGMVAIAFSNGTGEVDAAL